MNKVSVQKGFLIFILTFIVINLLFLLFWFKYGVQSSIKQGYMDLQNELQNDIIDNINKNIRDHNSLDAPSLFNLIAKKYNLLIIVRDSNNEIIFNNTQNISDREYLTPFVVTLNNNNYIVSIGKINTINTISITKKFMIFEIIFLSTITLVGLFIANKVLLEPIEKTIKDINNYKFGVKPTKRPVTNEIYYLQNEFVDLTKSLEKEHNEQNRIISAISHDIKTPLTAIIGYSDLLVNKKLKKQEEKDLQEKIYKKAIDENSEYKKALSHKNRTYIFKEVLVKDLLDNIKFEYQEDLKDKNIKLDIINKSKKQTIILDIGKINRVFSNLIVNSIRYISDKGHITIECKDDKEYFYFKCIDNGTGVDENNINKIFEPLFTTDKSRKISGLGLSITKEIVEMHGGKIKAYNNKSKGLTIEFTLSKNLSIEEK